ncbi:hypothetical protein [Aquimarina litoralis]|uniref:hypothetical protein n=1 Tax=Aquimarina litoralis TaxID=584605 RepID=UPI001C56FDF1|nr:hypothetical protein [Aquimarina litoralis]MBW1294867.1 hypothetical protein [Aquimarina litoralis]
MKINPWAFGGLLLFCTIIWGYHYFTIPTFYPFERTGEVKAIVFQSKLVDPLFLDYDYSLDQIVHFVYRIDDVVYVSKHRVERSWQFQKIGDSLLIRYSVNDPQRTDPIRYYHNVSNKSGFDHIKKCFLHTKDNGYKSLDLYANIFTYEDYGSYGKLITKTTGSYMEKDSVLTLTPLIYYQNRKVADTIMELPKPINEDFEKIYLSNFKQNSNGSITEMNTNLLFNLAGQK